MAGALDVVSGLAPVIGSVANAVSTGVMNRKSRKWNEKMWHLQNEYNLPSAQMQRFKDAGLNPHLIYGQGNAGNAGSPSSWSPDAVDMSAVGGAVGKYFTTKLQQGQLERQRLENAILATDLDSKEIDVDVKKKLTNVVTLDGSGDLGMSSRNMLFQGQLADLNKKRWTENTARIADIISQKTLNANIDRSVSAALNEAARTGLINAHTANSLTDNQLKQLEAVVRKYEAEFIQNFDVKSGDVFKMISQSIPFILQSILRGNR